MGPIETKIVMALVNFLIAKVITPEHIKGLEKEVIALLRAAAAKTPNPIDNEVVEALAKALGVE